jgi:uncharacterized protein (TIGR00369 family)
MNQLLELYNKTNNFGKLIGMTIEQIEPGHVTYKLNITDDLLATPTTAHGGALAAFMDAIIGVASLSLVAHENKVVSTVEFKINFLQPALYGERLKGIGKVLKKGKRIIVAEGKIFNQKNELLATSTGTLNAYPIERSDFNKNSY